MNCKRNFRESYVFHCLVIKVVSLLFQNSLFILSHIQVFVNNFFQISFSKKFERRRRDLNPRAAINDLLPFQGSPFGQLGYFSKSPYLLSSYLFNCLLSCESLFSITDVSLFVKNFFKLFSKFNFKFLTSGESGIRTHAPLRTNGFQDRLVMTTSISLHINQ